MKFERFQTESYHDFLIIGDPGAFETANLSSIINLGNDSDKSGGDYSQNGKVLILNGNQTTGIWATATSIKNFDITFKRMMLLTSNQMINLSHSITFDQDRDYRASKRVLSIVNLDYKG